VTLGYNIGIRNLAGSTLLAKHIAGDHAAAQAQFGRWNRAAGQVMSGLTKRRAAEAALYGQKE
jgi:GH24 family phage-related lysozyme (muramidase)